MKARNLGVLIALFVFTACASLPKETVTLSQTLGSDLIVLHNAHRNIIELHFNKIEDDINSFVNDVYAPFIIHYALKSELKKYKEGNSSLYGIIEIAGKEEGKKESEDAINVMQEFQEAARKQIEKKRSELLTPIIKQRGEIIVAINQSYDNAIYANSTITVYLQSLQKVKSTQQDALSLIGLKGADTLITNSIVQVSEQVEKAVKMGKDIDIKSDDALIQMEKIENQIKEITNKK
jgi:hypothetical protein